MFILKIFKRKKAKNNIYLDVHVGELKGTYDYYKSFIKTYPTYDKIKSDYIF